MSAATLSIGDELISGRIRDGNAAVIAAALLELGLRVRRHTGVGDDLEEIAAVLDELARQHQVLIISGGLGPTADDLTTAAAGRATGRELVLFPEARRHVRHMSGKLANLLFCPLHDQQALFPSGAELIPNPLGTACGFRLVHHGCRLFFLPGVPVEMEGMLRGSVLPLLREDQPLRRVIRYRQLNVFGPCEAEVDALLAGVARPEAGLSLGICVSYPAMAVTVQAEAADEEAADALLVPALQEVRQRLGEFIFSEGDQTLDQRVAELFRQQGVTLALAESCTGGMIAEHITAVPGSSAYFLEGAVTYSNDAKQRRLGVPEEVLVEQGAVSAKVAAAMAQGIRNSAASDLGLAVTGIAGPDGGSPEKPVGTVFIALVAGEQRWVRGCLFRGSRQEVRTMTAWTALDWLRRHLQGRDGSGSGVSCPSWQCA